MEPAIIAENEGLQTGEKSRREREMEEVGTIRSHGPSNRVVWNSAVSHRAEILVGLERALAQDARLNGAATVPVHVLTIVDLYGEPMDSDPRFRTMAEWKSRKFSVDLQKWLHEQSRKLRGASLDEAAETLRDSPEFRGQFLVFTSLSDFAAWFAEPIQKALDSYVTCYIDDGFPIFRVSPFMDGKRPKRNRK